MWRRRIDTFFNRARGKKQKGDKMSLKLAKLANKDSLMALDHLMQGGIDDCLQNYRVSYESVQFPLKDWQRRFWVDISSLPPCVPVCGTNVA